MSTKLSIITPVYNSASFIKQCIQNVIDQNCDLELIEHLFIDGASNDGTVDIIKAHTSKYEHIHLISEKDSGQSEAMNKGIRIAKGEYISFLNVDDFYSPNTLNEIIQLTSTENSPEFLVGNCNVWLPNNNLQYVNKPYKLKPWHLLSGYYLPVNPSAYFYKKKIHTTIGFYNESNHFNMDLEFLIQASMQYNLIYFPKTWGNFQLTLMNKTTLETESGLLEVRKKKLFDDFLLSVNIRIRILTYWTRLQKKTIRKLTITKKNMYYPIDLIYWKFKKLLK